MSDDEDEAMPTIVLGDGDAAIIIKSTGDIESLMPVDGDDSQDVSPGSPTVIVAVLMYLLTDENRYRAIEAEFLSLCRQSGDKTMLH